MIRIIFEDGSLIDCEHIAKIFVETEEQEKISFVNTLSGPILKVGKNEGNTDREEIF